MQPAQVSKHGHGLSVSLRKAQKQPNATSLVNYCRPLTSVSVLVRDDQRSRDLFRYLHGPAPYIMQTVKSCVHTAVVQAATTACCANERTYHHQTQTPASC
jgi:hypothetical protein